jgi:hypothetical protein
MNGGDGDALGFAPLRLRLYSPLPPFFLGYINAPKTLVGMEG